MSLDLQLSPAQQADLDAFLEEQRNPSSPEYRYWLTPAQFADRFGSSANDVAKIVSWLEAQGFTIEHIGAARTTHSSRRAGLRRLRPPSLEWSRYSINI
jgi:subtilase family serine protease